MFPNNNAGGSVAVGLGSSNSAGQSYTYTLDGGNGTTFVGNTFNGVYQSGPLVMDDKQSMEQMREFMERTRRAEQEELEATNHLFELLEGLRARCDEGWEDWD